MIRNSVDVQVPLTIGAVSRTVEIVATYEDTGPVVLWVSIDRQSPDEKGAPMWLWDMIEEDLKRFGPIRRALDEKLTERMAQNRAMTTAR